MKGNDTEFGFVWGPVEVKRVTTHHGDAVIAVETNREIVYLRITPTGLIRVDAHTNKKQALREAGKG